MDEVARAWLKVARLARELARACRQIKMDMAAQEQAWHEYRLWLRDNA